MAANQVGVNIIRDITDAEIASIKAKGEIQRSKMRMAHLDEMERLKAEGERLKAEGEAIAAQDEKNGYFRENIKLYEGNKKDISDTVSPRYVQIKNRREAKTYHVRAEVCEKIKETVKRVNLTIHKCAKETIQNFQGNRPITNILLNKANNSEILENIFKG